MTRKISSNGGAVTRGAIFENRAAATLTLAVVACGLVAAASATRLSAVVELNGFDRLVNTAPEAHPAPQIAFVDISDETVAHEKRWPIPRGRVAQAIRRIAEGEPELIGLDIQLAERREPAEDEALQTALAQAGNVVIPSSRTEPGVLTEPLPEFRDAALDVALVDLYLDPDGAIRRVPLALVLPGFQRLGFAAALASNYSGLPLKREGPSLYSLGPTRIPFQAEDSGDAPSALIGQWVGPGLRVEFTRVLAPDFDPVVFRDKIVIVGESSTAGKDSFETPLYPREGLVSGPEIHMAGLAALLDGRVVDVVRGWRLWAINLLAALVALSLVMHGRPAWSVPTLFGLVLAVFGLALWLLKEQNLWLPYVSTAVTILVSLPIALGYRYLHESRQERMLRKLFGRYVSREVLQEILRHPEQVVIEGQERTATVLFTDIRGFTSASAGAQPRDVIGWLNEYFAAMSEVIDRNRGFLNKFIGDGLMVVFGAPVSEGERCDAERAARTALEMVARLESLNADNQRRQAEGLWRPPIHIGVGVHTGPVAAGNVGAPERMEYSLIGDTVNLAARLESATRRFPVDILISPATQRLVADRFETESLGMADVKGFSDQVEVYTVRGEVRPPGGVSS